MEGQPEALLVHLPCPALTREPDVPPWGPPLYTWLKFSSKFLHIFQVCSIIFSQKYENFPYTEKPIPGLELCVMVTNHTLWKYGWKEGEKKGERETEQRLDPDMNFWNSKSHPPWHTQQGHTTPPDPSKQFINWELVMQKYNALGGYSHSNHDYLLGRNAESFSRTQTNEVQGQSHMLRPITFSSCKGRQSYCIQINQETEFMV